MLSRSQDTFKASSSPSLLAKPWRLLSSSQSSRRDRFTPLILLQRTYGIPSISKLLCETQQLGKVEYAGRRYADTAILIIEFTGHSPRAERTNEAIARMNYLHSRYQKAGKISNDDMLYTLSLFVLEVERWVGLYEWRSLTPLEICAT